MYVLQEAPSLSVCTDRGRFNTHACALTASWMFVNIPKNQGGDKAVKARDRHFPAIKNPTIQVSDA